ncbi:UPF0739 protein C1orf74 homolog [Glandiceps talaboti]
MAAPGEIKISEWKQNIQKYLPKPCRTKVLEILSNVLAVQEEIKPSFLFDYAMVDAERMQMFLSCSKATDTLRSLSLHGDVFIYNPKTLRNHLNNVAKNSSCFLVDVSGSLCQPKIASQDCHQVVLRHVNEVLTALDEQSDIQIALSKEGAHQNVAYTLQPTEGWNIPSIFGILLGYPVVYWYGVDDDTPSNCLSMVPLSVHKIFIRPDNNEGKEIISFSVPADLEESFHDSINVWYSDIKCKVTSSAIFNNFECGKLNVCLPSVIL